LQGLEDTGQLSDAIKALQWLCFANRPLRLAEMVDVLAIENGQNGGFFPEERLPDPADIMVICSSLISLTVTEEEEPHDEDSDDEDSDFEDRGSARHANPVEGANIQIQLAHFSVKEFLLSDRCAFRLDFQPRICHSLIAESCLYYLFHLSQSVPLIEELVVRHPLSFYAAEQWWQHLQVINADIDESLLQAVVDFLARGHDTLLCWQQLYDADRPGKFRPVENQWSQLTRSPSSGTLGQPLYYAAQIGVPAVVKKIVARTMDVNVRGGLFSDALQAAAARGHDLAIQILLRAGADLNAQGGIYGNALQAAAAEGHIAVVQVLLDAGVDVNARGGWYRTALLAAAAEGHIRVVQMLLDAGADVNAHGEEYGHALEAAATKGYKGVVRVLLDAGADVNVQRGRHGSALGAACYFGHKEVVQMLLDAGANLDAQADDSNAIQAASYFGHEEVVQILREAGATLHTSSGLPILDD
jgi:ankyrin repeat protein